jgi:hypothetical protein
MLGHARIASTELCTKAFTRQLQRVHTASHPAALPEHRRVAGVDDLAGDDDRGAAALRPGRGECG